MSDDHVAKGAEIDNPACQVEWRSCPPRGAHKDRQKLRMGCLTRPGTFPEELPPWAGRLWASSFSLTSFGGPFCFIVVGGSGMFSFLAKSDRDLRAMFGLCLNTFTLPHSLS